MKDKVMKIAVIGGGKRCEALLEMFDAMRFPHLEAQIVAVADLNEEAAGVRLAREKGIFTTTSASDFFKLDDLDLVIELTGNEGLLEDFLKRKPEGFRALETTLSKLFSNMIRFQEEYLLDRRRLELIQSIVESVFSSIQDHVLILHPDMKVMDANEAILQSVGMNRQEILGKYCYQISHCSIGPCNEKGHPCPLQESMATGRPAHAIHEHFNQRNEPRTCEITVVPLKNKQGETELILEIMRDITDEMEKRVEQKTKMLTRNLARLIHEDKMIALGKLVASAVHEINNPLTGIHALARLVSRGLSCSMDEEELKQYKYYLDLIDTESARCSAIVGNLLSFARQQKMERKRFQLNELVERVAALFSHKMQLQNVRLERDLEADLPPMLGDAGQIQQCLVNLMFNAMEAMPEGGMITIRTAREPSQNNLRMEVEDSGVGIPEEIIPHIFEPFFSTKSQDKGVGLGLSVVYGIIKEHHGSIYVKSEKGKGSIFIIRFSTIDPAEGGKA